jgi:predicted pyridoxine 5'-phosphate oxidase superfamily flavin-nucleotide-binding protein
MILQSLYPSTWRAIPFHEGELDVQKRLGVYESVLTYGPRGIRPFLPEQHISFYQNQPFLVAAARDNRGKMWSTLLFGPSSKEPTAFTTSPHPQTLMMETKPLPGDALESSLQEGTDLGILGIEFATRRRNRVNGRIASNDGQKIEFKVDLSFGNCMFYIGVRPILFDQ